MSLTKNVTIKQGQSIFDVTLQLFGDNEKVFDLIKSNPVIENIEIDLTGLELTYEINDTNAQKYYISKNLSIATKPINYKNKDVDFLICENGKILVQENTYKIDV